MTLIRHGAKAALSISYDATDSVTLMQACPPVLRSLIDLAIRQWWDGLTKFQRSAHSERELSFKILATYQSKPE
jgi:hypothetical protein